MPATVFVCLRCQVSGRIQVHAAALANASDSEEEVSRLEVHAKRRLGAIRVWRINQWRKALCEQEKVSHTSDEESEDSNGDEAPLLLGGAAGGPDSVAG